MIHIHGGGWVIGDKNDCRPYALELYNENMIVANINYRLLKPGSTTNYKDMLTDVKHVIGFLHQNAEKYGIDRKEFSLVGSSAGAHLALLYAYMADTANAIRSVVSYIAPSNINDRYFKKMTDSVWKSPDRLDYLLGERFVLNSEAAIHCSPVYFVKNKPTLLIHGTKDDIVPFEQSVALNDSLNKKGVRHLLIAMPEHRHEGPQPGIADSVRRTVRAWLFQ